MGTLSACMKETGAIARSRMALKAYVLVVAAIAVSGPVTATNQSTAPVQAIVAGSYPAPHSKLGDHDQLVPYAPLDTSGKAQHPNDVFSSLSGRNSTSQLSQSKAIIIGPVSNAGRCRYPNWIQCVGFDARPIGSLLDFSFKFTVDFNKVHGEGMDIYVRSDVDGARELIFPVSRHLDLCNGWVVNNPYFQYWYCVPETAVNDWIAYKSLGGLSDDLYHRPGRYGANSFEIEVNGVMQGAIPFSLSALSVAKKDGDAQEGLIKKRLPKPLTWKTTDHELREAWVGLEHYSNAEYGPSPFESRVGSPTGAVGASFVPTHGSGYLTLGDKIGVYAVELLLDSTPESWMPINYMFENSPPFAVFTAVAKEGLPAPDHPEAEEENGDESKKDCAKVVADPIDLSTGNVFSEKRLYEQRGDSPLEFTLYYNSLGNKSRITQSLHTTSLDRYVVLPVGDGPAKVRRPDGRTIRFDQVGAAFAPQPHFLERLERSGSGWKFTDANQTIELFDSTGNLLSITDLRGRTITAKYSKGKLVQVSENTAGQTMLFAYDGKGRLSTATMPDGIATQFEYDAYGNLSKYGNQYGYSFPAYDDLDYPYGMTAGVFDYDALGRAISGPEPSSVSPSNDRIDIVYHDDGRRTLTRIRDGESRVTEVALDRINGRGFPVEFQGPAYSECGLADGAREFDAAMNITASTQWGVRTEYGEFDAKRQPGLVTTGATTGLAQSVEIEYDPRFIGKPTKITSPSVFAGGRMIASIVYDDKGNITEQRVDGFRPDGTPVSRKITAEYAGPWGQITRYDGPRTDATDVTTWTYDSRSKKLVSVTDARGILVRSDMQYNTLGLLGSELTPNGRRVSNVWDSAGLLSERTETGADGARRQTDFGWTDPNGDYKRVLYFVSDQDTFIGQRIQFSTNEKPLGATSFHASNQVNARERVASHSVGLPAGLEAYASYDGAAPSPSNLRTLETVERDAYDRIVSRTSYELSGGAPVARGAIRTTYHPDGTVASVVDADGNTTNYLYDELQRVIREEYSDGSRTLFAYDVHGRTTRVESNTGVVTTFAYDDLGNLLEESSPDRGDIQYQHDSAGNVIAKTDAEGRVTRYAYDAVNALVSIDRTGTAHDVTYIYGGCAQGVGRLCSVRTGEGEIVSYAYDSLGRVVRTEYNTVPIQYAYRSWYLDSWLLNNSQVTKADEITYPSGRIVRFEYGDDARVSSVILKEGGNYRTLVEYVDHQPFGGVTTWANYSRKAGVQSFEFGGARNLSGQPRTWRVNAGQTEMLGYDERGLLVTQDNGSDASVFDFDSVGRLIGTAGSLGTRAYGYDLNGNRTTLSSDGVVTPLSYVAGSNRLSSDGAWNYTLSADGSTTRKLDVLGTGQGWRFDYGDNRRMVAAFNLASPSVPVASYRYNGLGQRTQKTAGGKSTRYIYGKEGELLAEVVAAR